ncbi:MAG: hypothetical protein K1X74_08150 [Pirellulales bacterium]|nr:hypothetical protein [Pirellulales bacterium]
MRHSRQHRRISGQALLLAFLCLPGLVQPGRAQAPNPAGSTGDNDDEGIDTRPAPGLLATYRGQSASITFSRLEDEPTLFVAADEVPDPRLSPRAWSVQWSGQLESIADASYRLAALIHGTLSVRVDGQLVLQSKSDEPAETVSEPFAMPLGWHAVEIDFAPAAPDAQLRLSWESDFFAREPIPASSWGVPAAHQEQPATGDLDPFDAGQLMFEEHNCIRCHGPEGHAEQPGRPMRPAPRLELHAPRLNRAWVAAWLDDPQAYRAEATMPRVFADGPTDRAERWAIARLLAASDAPAEVPPRDDALAAQGEALFNTIGCTVCHLRQGQRPARATLARIGSKLANAHLVEFLQHPEAIDPAGRMPNLRLEATQATALATWLIARDAQNSAVAALPAPSDAEITAAFDAANPAAELRRAFEAAGATDKAGMLGRAAIAKRRCQACHELAPQLVAETISPSAAPSLGKITEHVRQAVSAKHSAGGCLAPAGQAPVRAPRFGSSLHRENTAHYLATAAAWPPAAAPRQAARLTLARFNCLGCHQRGAQGGLASELLTQLMAGQSAEAAEMIAPPPLTSVTYKLRSQALADVLTGDARSRPWMSLRMPDFGTANVGELPRQLAALEGHRLATDSSLPEPDPELAEAGRTLMGSQGFGCTKCHDLLGHASSGTRGPDLAKVPQRIERAWYERWMIDPQRIQPGTRMPTVFFQGQSPYKNVLAGDPARQREAIWHYLIACRNLPLPEGVRSASSEPLASDAVPELLRTFLPDLTPRSIAIRGHGGVHFAFDAQACRMAYAWTGDFLDAEPAWSGRGGRPARPLGPIVWRAPAGFPWAVTSTRESPPDFAAQAADPAYGAMPPEDGRIHPRQVRFGGYRQSAGAYQWSYALLRPGDVETASELAQFREQTTGRLEQGACVLQRRWTVSGETTSYAWLRVASLDREPVRSELPRLPGQAVWKWQATDAPQTWCTAQLPAGAQWQLDQRDGRFDLLIVMPLPAQETALTVRLAIPQGNTPVDEQTLLDAFSRSDQP